MACFLIVAGAHAGAPAAQPDAAAAAEAGTVEAPSYPSYPADAPAEPASDAQADEATGDQHPGLSADVVYAVLVAEVALQRDDQRKAFTHYRHAAHLTRDAKLAELAARAALAMEDTEAALEAAELWVELAPDAPRARQIAAYARLDAGDRDGALADLEALIGLLPDRGQGYLQAAQMLSRIGEPAQRLEMMRRLVADEDADADAQYALAMLAAGADEVDQARAYALQAVELRPQWEAPRVFLVRLLATADRLDEAEAVLDDFLAELPENQELSLLRAQMHIDAEEYPAALAIFDGMLSRDGAQPDVLFTSAMVALEAGELERARGYLTALRATGARASDAAFLLGQVEEEAGNTQAALDWYGKVRGENVTNARVRVAGILLDRGEVEQARELLQRLRDRFPGQATTFFLIEGELLRERELEQLAIDVYTDALSEVPDDPDLLYARAMIAAALDRVDLLEQDLRRILVSDPDHVDALNALGYTLADRTDRLAEARSLIERAIQLRPEEPAILDSMGWVLFRLGDPGAAEPFLRRALEGSFDPEIAAHLGEVLWALGRKDEAREVWDRALETAPEHEYLLRTLGRHRITHNSP